MSALPYCPPDHNKVLSQLQTLPIDSVIKNERLEVARSMLFVFSRTGQLYSAIRCSQHTNFVIHLLYKRQITAGPQGGGQ